MDELPEAQQVVVEFRDLLADPRSIVQKIYTRFGLEISEEFDRYLEDERRAAKEFRSQHEFEPEGQGPARDRVRRELADLFERFGWSG